VDKRKKKIVGVLVAFVGVFVSRLGNLITLQPAYRYVVYLLGVFIALAGIVVFASGMEKSHSVEH
jgi:drug/metabolite transporter (DMT)-like permease